jgi:F0F1-type ATP synthase membrane subunit b/b'
MGDILSRLGHLFVQSAPTVIFVFLLLVFLERLFFRRLTEVLKEREARTAGALERAREQAATAEMRSREYEAAFQAMRQELYRQREVERKESLVEREETLRKARQQNEARLAEMQAALAAEVQFAKDELRVACQALANEITETLIGNGGKPQAGRPS